MTNEKFQVPGLASSSFSRESLKEKKHKRIGSFGKDHVLCLTPRRYTRFPVGLSAVINQHSLVTIKFPKRMDHSPMSQWSCRKLLVCSGEVKHFVPSQKVCHNISRALDIKCTFFFAKPRLMTFSYALLRTVALACFWTRRPRMVLPDSVSCPSTVLLTRQA